MKVDPRHRPASPEDRGRQRQRAWAVPRAVWAFLLLFLTRLPTLTAEEPSSPALQLECEGLTFDARASTAHATGGVKATYGKARLEADEILVDLEDRQAQASGDVRLQRGEDLLECDALTYRWEEQTGTLQGGRLLFAETGYRIEGAYLEKTGPDTYSLQEGSFTTCLCPSEQDRLPWKVKAGKAEISVGGYAKAEKAVFLVSRVPVLYLPVAYVPVKVHRESGFLVPSLGQSGRSGWEISVPFFWAVDASTDATFTLNGMTKRGIKPEAEFRYRPSRRTEGEWRGAAFHDFQADRFRYGITGVHNQDLSESAYDKIDLKVVSDNDYPVDFSGEVGSASDRLVESRCAAGWRKENLHGTVEAAWSDLVESPGGKDVPQRFPHLHVDYLERSVLFPWLLAGWRSGAAHFMTENGDRRGRYEIFPRLGTAFSVVRGIHLRTLLGVREILSWQDWEGERSEGGDSRTLFHAGSELEATLGRRYAWRDHGLFHILRPRIQYQWVEEVAGRPMPVVLDGLDGLRKRNWVTLGLTTSLWRLGSANARGPGLVGMPVAEFSLAQSMDLDRDAQVSPTQRLFSDLALEAKLAPSRFLLFRADLQIDPYSGSLRVLETEGGVRLWENRLGLQAGYLHHRSYLVDPVRRVELWDAFTLSYPFEGIERTIRTRVEGKFREQWAASLDTLYLVERSGKIENRFLLKYLSSCKCWSVVAGIRQTMRPEDVSFSVRFQLEGLGSHF
mgnify:CR=1 FL=1